MATGVAYLVENRYNVIKFRISDSVAAIFCIAVSNFLVNSVLYTLEYIAINAHPTNAPTIFLKEIKDSATDYFKTKAMKTLRKFLITAPSLFKIFTFKLQTYFRLIRPHILPLVYPKSIHNPRYNTD